MPPTASPPQPRTIDTEVLREHLGPHGPWAREAGQIVKALCDRWCLKPEDLAEVVGVTPTTIKAIIAGRIVPRDYLRASIALVLGKDSADIWRPLSLERVQALVDWSPL